MRGMSYALVHGMRPGFENPPKRRVMRCSTCFVWPEGDSFDFFRMNESHESKRPLS